MAWIHAPELEPPAAIEAGWLIDRFGAQAVYGRTMSVKEMRHILTAEKINRRHRAELAAREVYEESQDDGDSQY